MRQLPRPSPVHGAHPACIGQGGRGRDWMAATAVSLQAAVVSFSTGKFEPSPVIKPKWDRQRSGYSGNGEDWRIRCRDRVAYR